MCWDCAAWKPGEWLNIFESFQPIGWYFGKRADSGVFEFILEGERWHTNPQADPEWMRDTLPGDVDDLGYPCYLPGPYEGEYSTFREKYHQRG